MRHEIAEQRSAKRAEQQQTDQLIELLRKERAKTRRIEAENEYLTEQLRNAQEVTQIHLKTRTVRQTSRVSSKVTNVIVNCLAVK